MQLIRAKETNILVNPICSELTVAKAQRGPSFSLMRSNSGSELIIGAVVVLLREAVLCFNNSVTADQLVGYARRVVVDYYHWRMEDLVLCLNRGVRGDYGHSMARWTYGDTFITWAEGYEKERIQWCVDNNVNNKHEAQRTEVMNPNIFTQEVKDKLSKPKEIKTANVQTRERNKTDGWIDGFKKLNMEQNGANSAIGYVKYKNRMVDITEYLVIKMDETN